MQERGGAGGRSCLLTGTAPEECGKVPATVRGELADAIGPLDHQLPQLLGGADAAGEPAAHPHDGDGLPLCVLDLAQSAADLVQVGGDPLEVVESLVLIHGGSHSCVVPPYALPLATCARGSAGVRRLVRAQGPAVVRRPVRASRTAVSHRPSSFSMKSKTSSRDADRRCSAAASRGASEDQRSARAVSLARTSGEGVAWAATAARLPSRRSISASTDFSDGSPWPSSERRCSASSAGVG